MDDLDLDRRGQRREEALSRLLRPLVLVRWLVGPDVWFRCPGIYTTMLAVSIVAAMVRAMVRADPREVDEATIFPSSTTTTATNPTITQSPRVPVAIPTAKDASVVVAIVNEVSKAGRHRLARVEHDAREHAKRSCYGHGADCTGPARAASSLHKSRILTCNC